MENAYIIKPGYRNIERKYLWSLLFKIYQPFFHSKSMGEPGKFSVCPDHSVTWYNERDRVLTVGHTNSSCCFFISYGFSDIFIGAEFTISDFRQFTPHSLLKICTPWIDYHIEFCSFPLKILSNLVYDILKKRSSIIHLLDISKHLFPSPVFKCRLVRPSPLPTRIISQNEVLNLVWYITPLHFFIIIP